MINGPVAEHLEVLRRALGGCVRVSLVPRVNHAHAVHRPLLDPVDRVGRGNACRFEDRRHDVDHVVELGADAALVGDMPRPRHAHSLASAAEVRRHLLAPLERRVESPGPSGGVVRESLIRAPELVEQELVFHRHGHAVEESELVRRAIDRPLRTRSIVAADVDDQRVIELAHVLDRLNDAADFVVGVSEVGREDVGLLDEEFFLCEAQRVPFRQFLGPRQSAWCPAG